MKFNSGDLVKWQERSGSVTCTGKIVCEDRSLNGSNIMGFYTIHVDMLPLANYRAACHTAREMNSQMVSRSVFLHQLQLAEQ